MVPCGDVLANEYNTRRGGGDDYLGEERKLGWAADVICHLPPDRARREITLYLSYPCPQRECKQCVYVCQDRGDGGVHCGACTYESRSH